MNSEASALCFRGQQDEPDIGRHGVENANNRLPGLSLDVVERYCNLDVCCYIRNPQQVSERDRIMEWLSKGRDERCNVPYVGSLEG
jgi:hypothetical protein